MPSSPPALTAPNWTTQRTWPPAGVQLAGSCLLPTTGTRDLNSVSSHTLTSAARGKITTTVSGFLEREQPDVVVTMEPGGVTAHPDHMAVTAATQAAFGAYVAAPRERVARFYYWGVAASDMAGWRELGRASGFAVPGADDPYGSRGTPDDQFTCVVDTSGGAEQAYRALCQHRTQAGDPWYQLLAQQDNWRAVFARSRFVRVHPAPHPDDPPETSLVEAFGNG